MIEVTCRCGLQFELPEHWGGKQARCPGCRTPLTVPAASAPAPPVQQQPPPVQQTHRPPAATVVAAQQPAPAATAPPPVQNLPPQPEPQQPVAPSDSNVSQAENAHAARPAPPWLIPAVAGGAVALLLLIVAAGWMFWPANTHTPAADGVAVNDDDAAPSVDADGAAPAADGEAAADATASADGSSTVSTDGVPADDLGTKPSDPPPDDGAPAVLQPADGGERQPAAIPPKVPGDDPSGDQPGETIALSGQSRRFDDRECVALQNKHGVPIPPTADMIEVDGQRLPLADVAELQQSVAPVLILPQGVHTVRFRRNENPFQVKIEGHFIESYHAARAFFGLGGQVRTVELLRRSAWAYDSHRAPLLLNFYGASYASEQKWEAAQRKFRRALRVNPTFAPAHLNLAHCLLSDGDIEGARREVALADAFNIGNVYGIAHAISTMKQATEPQGEDVQPGAVTRIVAAEYFSKQQLSAEDERIEAMLLSLSKYAVRDSERGKIINNLAAHLADRGNTDAALHYYRAALETLKKATAERLEIARKVLQNMAAACTRAGYEEAAEYQQMRRMVTQ